VSPDLRYETAGPPYRNSRFVALESMEIRQKFLELLNVIIRRDKPKSSIAESRQHTNVSSKMPPRLSLGPLRCIRGQIPRRSYATSTPLPLRSYRNPLLFGGVVFGLGTYYLSRPSHAEVQSTKTQSQNENRELTASASRKAAEKDGKAEKESHQTGRSSQDNKPEKAVAEKKPQKGADEDSATGKVKGGHDESGQPKDDRLRGKGGKISKDDKNDNKNAEKDQQNKDKNQGKEEEEDNEQEQQGQQAVSISPSPSVPYNRSRNRRNQLGLSMFRGHAARCLWPPIP
jgi:hypothetical protein